MLDDDGIADQCRRDEEAQHLPEGQVPGHHAEDRPDRFVNDMGGRPRDGLGREISLTGFGEVARARGSFLDLADGFRQGLAHLGGDEAAIGLGPRLQQFREAEEEGDPLGQRGAGPALPALPDQLQPLVGLGGVMLGIGAEQLARRGVA
jgi:hypothetical protein